MEKSKWIQMENAKFVAAQAALDNIQDKLQTVSSNLTGKTYTSNLTGPVLTVTGTQVHGIKGPLDSTGYPYNNGPNGPVFIGDTPGQQWGTNKEMWIGPNKCFPDINPIEKSEYEDTIREYLQRQASTKEVEALRAQRAAEEKLIQDLVKERKLLQQEVQDLAKDVTELRGLIQDMQNQFESLVENEANFEAREA
jgi:hypothetical protein